MNLEHLGSTSMEPAPLRQRLSNTAEATERARAAGESLERVDVPELPGGQFSHCLQECSAELGRAALSHAQWASDLTDSVLSYADTVEVTDGDLELMLWAQ